MRSPGCSSCTPSCRGDRARAGGDIVGAATLKVERIGMGLRKAGDARHSGLRTSRSRAADRMSGARLLPDQPPYAAVAVAGLGVG